MFKKNSSNVWKYFEKIPMKPNEAVCKICKTSYKHGHGTSNLFEHLRRKHQTKLDADNHQIEMEKDLDLLENFDDPSTSEIVKQNQLYESRRDTTNDAQGSSEPPAKIKKTRQLLLSKRFNEPSINQKGDFISNIMEMIYGDLQPISFVENNGFRNMVRFLDSRYLELIPSRRIITNKIMPDLYLSTKQKIELILNQTSEVAITSDIWTSRNIDSYLTITAHLYDKDYRLKTFVLTTEKLEQNHTALYIYETLTKVFEKWSIQNKIIAIVTDSGANVKAAIKKFSEIPHIPCTAHKLNLIVTDALKVYCQSNEDGTSDEDSTQNLNVLLKKCRSIVAFFKKSEVANRSLQDKLKQLGKPPSKLKQDVSTRWNSCLLMLEKLVSLKEPVTCVIMSLKNSPTYLLPFEWRIIEEIIPLLTPFNLMTIELSGEKYPTLAMVIPLVRGVNIAVKSVQVSTGLSRVLQIKLLENLQLRFNLIEDIEVSPCFGVSTLLDPRFKKCAFANINFANKALNKISNELAALISKNSNGNCSNVLNSTIIESQEENASSSDLWGFLTAEVEQEKYQTTSLTTAETILNQYLSLPLEIRSTKPLDFWLKHQTLLDPLFSIAMKYSIIPATSVPSERVFSKAGEILSAKRNRLDAKNVDILIFLNKNLKQLE